jgi:hypothetical protein
MKTVWTAGIEDEGLKKEVQASFKGSGIMRERLVDILKDKAESAVKAGRSKEAYDCPNWAYKKADEAGYNRALFEIISLISEKSVDKT